MTETIVTPISNRRVSARGAMFLAAFAWLPQNAPASGPDDEPVTPIAVLAVTGFDEMQRDLTFLGSLAGMDHLAESVGAAASSWSGSNDLPGVDRRRPWGLILGKRDLLISPILCMPISDADVLLRSAAPILSRAHPSARGLYPLGRRSFSGVMRIRGDWAYVGQTPEDLARLPDPEAIVTLIEQGYDVVAEFHLRQWPEAFRSMAIDALVDAEDTVPLPRRKNVAPPMERRRAITQPALRMLQASLLDVDRVRVGWQLDPTGRHGALDLTITAVVGTPLARRLAAGRGVASRFASLASTEAGTYLHLATPLALPPEFRRALLDFTRETVLAGAAAETPQSLPFPTDVLLSAADSLLSGRRLEMAVRVDGEHPPLRLTAGVAVENVEAVERRLVEVAAAMQDNPALGSLELDVEPFQGCRIHRYVSPASGMKMAKLFGASPDVYIAVGEKSVWFAAGADAVRRLRRGVSTEPAPAPPFDLAVHVGALLSAARALGDAPAWALVQQLFGVGDDRLRVSVQVLPSAVQVRLEAGESVLRAAAIGLRLAQGDLLPGRLSISSDRISAPPGD